MEKSFLTLKNPKAREAYVEAELVNGLAHQIRIIRQQRGLTQKQLAEKLGTTQTTVSRLENPSYGRYSLRSLLALSKVFDVALFVRYMPFSKFMPATWDTCPEHFEAIGYEDEASKIQFFTENKSGTYVSKVISNAVVPDYTMQKFLGETPTNMLPYSEIAKNYLDSFMLGIANNVMLTQRIENKDTGE
ncbi:MAG: helix-turn-helix domain-containing protein [Gallionella sp.]|nr:helix-turn-helix domain-containing protein [Gallionella sp.]